MEHQLINGEDGDLRDQLIYEREVALQELEQNMIEVGQMFKDFKSHIEETDQSKIDDIEYFINRTSSATISGVKNLEKAHNRQTTKSKCCLM